MTAPFPGKLAILQRVLPSYRVPFFDLLAASCQGGLTVGAGLPRIREAIDTSGQLAVAKLTPLNNIHLLGGSLYLCWQKGLLDWLKEQQPDALIVEANPRYLSSPRAIRWMKQHHLKVLGWGLGSASVSAAGSGFRKKFRSNFINQFDALLTYSQRGKEDYIRLGFPPERIVVAANAVTSRPSHPAPERPARLTDQPTILFVGRLQERKRVDLLITACARLAGNLHPRLVIIGNGPQLPALQSLAELVYPGTVFPGYLQGEALQSYFKQADLFVLPGTGGLAVQEAMGYGLPVIVGSGDGTQDDLVRPANGWVLPPDDLAALTETISSALADPLKLRRIGQESYRIVFEEVNLENMTSAFLEALTRY